MPAAPPPSPEEWTGRELAWRPGSISVMDYVLRSVGVGSAWDAETKLAYLTLFSRMGDDCTCHPTVEEQAASSGLSVSTTQRRIKWLEDQGFLESNRHKLSKKQNGKEATTYKLWPPWCPRECGVSVTPQMSGEEARAGPRCQADTAGTPP